VAYGGSNLNCELEFRKMRPTLLTMLALTCALSVLGQGTVFFNNRAAGSVVTHVYDTTGLINYQVRGLGAADIPSGNLQTNVLGPLLQGSSYWSSLLGAPGAGQPESSLVVGYLAAPVAGSGGDATTFRTGVAAGFIAGSTATFNNVPMGAYVATIEMVAWDNSSGLCPTWALASQAWDSGLIAAGTSGTFNLYHIGGFSPPAPFLNGLQSFNIFVQAPEPKSIALIASAAGMLVFFRLCSPEQRKAGSRTLLHDEERGPNQPLGVHLTTPASQSAARRPAVRIVPQTSCCLE